MKKNDCVYRKFLCFEYRRVGGVTLLQVMGFVVYQRVGNDWKVFFHYDT